MSKTSLFVDPKDEINVKFYIGIKNNELIGAIDEVSQVNGVDYEEHVASFREPNYRDVCELADKAMTLTQDGEYAVGVAKVRMSRIKKLLKSWDLKDNDGKSVPAVPASIDTLNPVVAFTLAAALEFSLGILDEAIS